MNQTGGLRKKDMRKTDVERLYNMLESGGVIIRVLAWGSLKCFVIEFTLANANDSEYMDLRITRAGSTGNTFDVPVTKYVLKIMIVHPLPTHNIDIVYTDHITGKQYSKESEIPSDIGLEVYTQTTAWQNSCTRGRIPVCPSPASMLFFDNKNGRRFIRYLKLKICGVQTTFDSTLSNDRNRMFLVCRYIYTRLEEDTNRGISLVLMPKVGIQEIPQLVAAAAAAVPTAAAAASAKPTAAAAAAVPTAAASAKPTAAASAKPTAAAAAKPREVVTDPLTFNEFMDLDGRDVFMGLPITSELRDEARALLLANNIKLFLAGISHLDLHGGNIMMSVTQRGNLKVNILDLGNSCIFWMELKNKFLDTPSKEELENLLLGNKEHGVAGAGEESLQNKFLEVDKGDYPRKKRIISNLFDTLQKMDMRGNLRVFPHYHDRDPTKSQMRWWDRIKELDLSSKDRYKYIIERAFDIVQAEEQNAAHVDGRSTLTMKMLNDLYESDNINGFDHFLRDGETFDIRPYVNKWEMSASQADIDAVNASNPQVNVAPTVRSSAKIGGSQKKTRCKSKYLKYRAKYLNSKKTRRKIKKSRMKK
jgi:hypothetical protein